MSSRLCLVLLFAFLWLLPSEATAQSIARSFAELQPIAKPGRKVTVFDVDGNRMTAKIVEVTASSLTVDVERSRGSVERVVFPEVRVREIRRTDSAWNGALIGLGIGYLLSYALCQNDGECQSGNIAPFERRGGSTDFRAMHVTGPLILASLVGGPILGGYIDSKFGNTTIYLAPARSAKASWRLAPWVAPRQAGTALVIRF